VKCPYCVCDGELYSAPYIQGDGALSKTHAYYYQVQTQLLVCSANYADFVVITFSSKNVNISMQRISKDEEFIKDKSAPLLIKWSTVSSATPQSLHLGEQGILYIRALIELVD